MAMIPETTKRMEDAARLSMKYCRQWKFQDDADNPMDAGQLEYGCRDSDVVDLPDEDDDECFYYVSPDGAIGRTEDNGETIEWLILPLTRTMASMPKRLIKGEPWPEEIPAPAGAPGPGKGGTVGFCPSCGKPLTANDRFCPGCGASVADRMGAFMAQNAAPQAQRARAVPQQPPYQQQWQQQQQQYIPQDDGPHKMKLRTASLLCYWFSFIGWLVSYYLADNKDPYLRFHLNQSLQMWIVQLVLYALQRIFDGSFLSTLFGLVSFAVFILWLIAFIGACKNQTKTAPLFDKLPPILK